MRAKEFQRQLTHHAIPPTYSARSAESEIFIAFDQLRDHGVTYSRVHLRRLIEQGQFPRPLLLSANRIAWRISDLANWKSSRLPTPRSKVPPEVA
jgi:predicted DNA-binding transcriptional regulator AlpA